MADGDVLVGSSWPAGFGEQPDNILILKVDGPTSEPVHVHSNQNTGKYYGSKTKQTKKTIVVTVEVLEGGKAGIAALDETGERTAESNLLKVKFSDDNETASQATITGEWIDNTQRNFGPKTPND